MILFKPFFLGMLCLGSVIRALPQPSTTKHIQISSHLPTAFHTSTALAPATTSQAPKNLTVDDLKANPIQFPPVNISAQAIPGASSNSTLVTVVPQLQDIITNSTKTKLSGRDIDVDKRFECDGAFYPWAYDWIWLFYANNFCNYWFPGSGTYYIAVGTACFTGTVPASGGYPYLDYTYCAKDAGLPYPTFVAITNDICQAEFAGIVNWDDSYWACPAYVGGWDARRIQGGDNFDNVYDASYWQLYAHW